MTLSNIFGKSCLASALVLCSLPLHAANLLSANPATLALTCDTATGPGAAKTIIVKPVATLTTNTILVTLGTVSTGLIVTPPASAVLNPPTNLKDSLTQLMWRRVAPGSPAVRAQSDTSSAVLPM